VRRLVGPSAELEPRGGSVCGLARHLALDEATGKPLDPAMTAFDRYEKRVAAHSAHPRGDLGGG
jgi:hypothetical protein